MGQISRYIFTVATLTAFLLSVTLSVTLVRTANAAHVDEGRTIFVENRCYKCHTVQSEASAIENEKAKFAESMGVEAKADDDEDDDKTGGDLSHVGKIRDSAFLKKFVQDPRDYFKDSFDCQRTAKKKYRKRFKGSDEELEALVAYISSLKYENQQAADFESCLKEE